jgi:uncharacterized protein YdaU (DUF1376 family)
MMPWFPGAFSGATRGWPLIATGAYRALLDCQWDLGSLPVSEKELRLLAGATAREWRIAWPYLEQKFPVDADDRRRNARLEQNRREALKLRDKHRRGAAVTNAQRALSGALSETLNETLSGALSGALSETLSVSLSGAPTSTSTSTSTSKRSHSESEMPPKAATSREIASGLGPENRPEALRIAEAARPECDPAAIVEKFELWLSAHPSQNWRKSLSTYAAGEHFSVKQHEALKARNLAAGAEPIAPVMQLLAQFGKGSGS